MLLGEKSIGRDLGLDLENMAGKHSGGLFVEQGCTMSVVVCSTCAPVVSLAHIFTLYVYKLIYVILKQSGPIGICYFAT